MKELPHEEHKGLENENDARKARKRKKQRREKRKVYPGNRCRCSNVEELRKKIRRHKHYKKKSWPVYLGGGSYVSLPHKQVSTFSF
jgi:CRISPR/Cas system CSM-associated protein Csm5 (group 7 of RAMP superfamily)